MSTKSVNRGNRRYAVPGTSNQTGNKAPRYRWPDAIRVLIHCIAHHLDYTDDMMGRLRTFPDTNVLYDIFLKTVPWFEEEYNTSQINRALEIGYPVDQLEPMSGAKVNNRLLYLFTEPKKGSTPRRYGISVEHPDNPQGNRRKCFVRCSVEIHRRLKSGEPISKAEIEEWSK